MGPTEPYPGNFPGKYPTKNICELCMIFITVTGNSKVLYDTHTSVRKIGMFCTLKPQYPGCGYKFFVPARNFWEFCTPVPLYTQLLKVL